MRKQDLFLEEAVLDDLAAGMNALEVPVSNRVFRVVALAVLFSGAVIILRLAGLGWMSRDFYSTRAYLNANALTFIPAERGLIVDRYGKPLAQNEPSFDLVLDISKFLKAYPDPLGQIGEIEKAAGADPGTFESLIQNSDPPQGNSLVLLSDLTVAQVLRLKALELEGVTIENAFRRTYDDPEAFAHVLGYAGLATKDDLKKDATLTVRDTVGKAGLEAQYDAYLRGAHGEVALHRDAQGRSLGNPAVKPAAAGDVLQTTVDKDLQEYFYERLKNQLANLGSPAGAGIAIDPRNGEILALVSLPSFNNQSIDPEALVDPLRPLFNRAISGLYSPGSTIKPLVAAAALKEGVLLATDKVFSRGYIEVPNPYNPGESSRFLDWKPNGWVNVYSALARSSNIFFYAAGGGLPPTEANIFDGLHFPQGLGISRLHEYWDKFGLGEKTGVDIPGEASGFLPSADAKQKKGGVWRLGDTYNVSIGQGDLLITPLELIDYIAAYANGGVLYEPHLVRKITDSGGGAVYEGKTAVRKNLTRELGQWIKEAQKGMRDGVVKPYGTSYTLNDLPFAVAAKTGSAQIENNRKVNALFAGYGPVDQTGGSQIAMLVLIEDAKEGSLNAVPVAHDVLKWYYEYRLSRFQSTNTSESTKGN